MPRPPQNKKNRLTRFTSRKVLYSLVVAVVFGAVGSYLTFFANANVSTAEGSVEVHNRDDKAPHNAGEVFDILEYATFVRRPPQPPAYQLVAIISYDARAVEFLGLQCVDNTGLRGPINNTCQSSSANFYYPPAPLFTTQQTACMTIDGSISGYSAITSTFRAKRDLADYRPYVHGQVPQYWYSSNWGYTTVGCGAVGSHALENWAGNTGTVGCSLEPEGSKYGPNCNSGPAPANPSGGTTPGTGIGGGGGPGTGIGGGGGGAGGGGGGSSATTQSDDPNSLPSSSDQGTEAKQPKVEPSPFFDGKLFAVGSDPYDNANTVSIGGLKLGYGWLYLAGGLAALGVGGFFTWKWWTGRHKGK